MRLRDGSRVVYYTLFSGCLGYKQVHQYAPIDSVTTFGYVLLVFVALLLTGVKNLEHVTAVIVICICALFSEGIIILKPHS